MNSVNDLITAIINREFDRDEIDADIEFVNKRFYMIQNYFDAVYKHTYGSSVASTLVHKKYITTEQYQDYIMELDSKKIDVVWNGMTLTDEVTKSMECTNAYCNNAQVVVEREK